MTKPIRLPGSARMSSAVIVGDMIFLKGFTPRESAGSTVGEQAADVLAQIDDVLARTGSGREGVVSVSIWLKNIADMKELNAVYDAWVSKDHLPVRACVQAELAQERYLLEIQAVAVRSGDAGQPS